MAVPIRLTEYQYNRITLNVNTLSRPFWALAMWMLLVNLDFSWMPSLIVAWSWDNTWCWSSLTSLDVCHACRSKQMRQFKYQQLLLQLPSMPRMLHHLFCLPRGSCWDTVGRICISTRTLKHAFKKPTSHFASQPLRSSNVAKTPVGVEGCQRRAATPPGEASAARSWFTAPDSATSSSKNHWPKPETRCLMPLGKNNHKNMLKIFFQILINKKHV